MSTRVSWCLFAAALLLAIALRVVGLGPSALRAGAGGEHRQPAAPSERWPVRPMHHDEANQAVRFGLLLEDGEYRYDRNDHHGPTLYYLALPSAWLHGQATMAALDERTLRMVPALFGVGTILLFAWLARGLGRGAVAAGALLAAVSPALTYYSRFYIQESLLVFFALGFLIAVGRYAERPGVWPALCAGLFAGLAYATKETSLIVLACTMAACVLSRALARTKHRTLVAAYAPVNALAGCGSPGLQPRGRRHSRPLHFALAVALAFIVAGTFYSSFFANPSGIVESFKAYSIYVQRGLDPNAHAEPWYYYLRVLAWSSSGGVVFTEAAVLLLALAGFVRVWVLGASGPGRSPAAHAAPPAVHSAPGTEHGVPRSAHGALFWPLYVSLYSLFTLVVFSALRYKTPWNLLPFYVGVVLMAGYGVAALVGRFRSRAVRAVLVAALLIAVAQLTSQSVRANFRYAADPRNPYAYVHTSPDLLRLVARIDALAAIHADNANMLVKVVAGPYEQWPLPWYLRGMKRVGYWPTAAAAQPLVGAPVIVASEANSATVEAALGDRYVSEFYGLRPGVLLTLYIERTLWDRYLSGLMP